ncbi:hypothetical protein BP5796_07062 [Coleophoma crateriformis]|uniref:NAD-dependent epimerase/dehydratase domain-containing protein n=1 Tax=Coleophoma crateriformis TaxID=565419 RepID=A0A3D8RI24_9HELO|nr:hypothetical protein BP5796_07062 [Coleophoma crateriformis]
MPATISTLKAARDATKGFPIVLVTGGSGYIGSHTVLGILKSGCAVVVVDSLINSHMEALIRVYHIAKTEMAKVGKSPESLPPLFLHTIDLCDKKRIFNVIQFWQTHDHPTELLKKLDLVDIGQLAANKAYNMREYPQNETWHPESLNDESFKSLLSSRGQIVAVIHFAALKAVGESVEQPLRYYQNNVTGLLYLLDAMTRFKVNRIVFSSSAVVYGSGKGANIKEDAVQVGGQGAGGGFVTNPYGRSKWMAEEILNDCCVANSDFQVISLRYFNPTGSHPSGLIGEDPKGKPNNIVPVILQAYQRRRSKVHVFGSDYDTTDGTGVRDYIHVEDLGRGHIAALRSLLDPRDSGRTRTSFQPDGAEPEILQNYRVYNLGSGNGYSVLEIIQAFASVASAEIPYSIGESRPGDLGTVTASTTKALSELGWQANFGIQDMCRDVHAFATENPMGYERLRRLSTLALKDPEAFHKASEEIGVAQVNLEEMMTGVARLASHENAFTDVVRRLSVLSDGIKSELRKESISDIGPPATALDTSAPSWAMFGDDWHKNVPARPAESTV